ncbi:sensor histidine kinase [Teredinibacter waterburyi]|jgi:Sensory transduction protein kinase AlgZ (EC 2.7.3.-)|uniref:sensor histidine kinase n=1 Tax=Teredinibacter waterburyi TaxID=1500538 RepID=UPI00165F54AB|nr:histidine kinase [Teredinibacter waterburyi]
MTTEANNNTTSEQELLNEFLPDLCSVQPVLALVLVSELVIAGLLLGTTGLAEFNFSDFGLISMRVQWIVLCSAGGLCMLRPWFRQQPVIVAGTVSFGLTLIITGIFVALSHWLLEGNLQNLNDELLSWILMGAVFGGIALRFLFLQQQLRNQQRAELLARLQALQSRIRPHFLFNSMNSIASLIAIDATAAERMVVDLAHLFRASLSESGLVSLSNELELCERYIGIEQLRLGQRLEVEWRYQQQDQDKVIAPLKRDNTLLQQLTIPSFLLQPLVENAICHGIQPLQQGGRISIELVLDAHNVTICISNPMLSADQKRNAHMDNSGNGMALDNIRNRLAAYYGDKGELKVVQQAEEFSAIVRYPVALAVK